MDYIGQTAEKNIKERRRAMTSYEVAGLLEERRRAVKAKDYDLVKSIDIALEDGVLDAHDMRLEINRRQPNAGWGGR